MIHEPAAIGSDVVLGAGTVVWPFASILSGTEIGDDCVVGTCCWIGADCTIGDKVRFNHGTFIPHGTLVGNGVFFGPGCVLTDDKYPIAGNRDYNAEPPVIRDGASLGAGVLVLPGVTIGEGAMVGAGAVVTQDVLDGEIVTGIPASTVRAQWIKSQD